MELSISGELRVFMYGLQELTDKTGYCPLLTLGKISPAHYCMEQFERILITAFFEGSVGFDDIGLRGRTFETCRQFGFRVRFGIFAAAG